MADQWQRKEDDELIREAQIGLSGQGAVVEMMRRLRDSLLRQQQATDRLSKWMLWLTIATVMLAIVEAIAAVLQIYGAR
jgi:hypothetical protein